MERRKHRWIAWAAAMSLLAGCDAGTDAGDGAGAVEVDYQQVRMMTDFYDAYVREHRGQPPSDEAAFRSYLQSKKASLQKVGLTVEDMFRSPDGEGQLAWVYGRKPVTSPAGISILAYEKESTDGKRLVLGTRGMYEELEEAEFRRLLGNTQ